MSDTASHPVGPLRLLAGSAHPALAGAIAAWLRVGLSRMRCGRFPDGKVNVEIEDDVRGIDTFVIQATSNYGLRPVSARRIAAIISLSVTVS